MQVLFVDDDTEVLQLLSTICSLVELEHDVAHNIDEALEKLTSRRFELVVTDLKMPDADGVVLARDIRDHHPDVGLFAFTGEIASYNRSELEKLFEEIYLKPEQYSRMIGDALKFLAIRKYPFLA